MCALLTGMAALLSGAITCSNIVGELWRTPMLTSDAISEYLTREMALSQAQPLATHMAF